MKKSLKGMVAALIVAMMMFVIAVPVFAAGDDDAYAYEPISAKVAVETEASEDSVISAKAMAAAIVVAVVATAGAISMGWAIVKSVDGISRQPEAEGKIRTTLMLGLVFVETAIIYALVVAILVIFVL